MKSVALPGIRLAQRWISPRKRFSCAHRVHTGNASCSWLGYRAIHRFGVWQGGALLQARFDRGAAAHRQHQRLHLHLRNQAGYCDGCALPCNGIDCVNCSGVGDCGNWGNSRKKDAKEQSN